MAAIKLDAVLMLLDRYFTTLADGLKLLIKELLYRLRLISILYVFAVIIFSLSFSTWSVILLKLLL